VLPALAAVATSSCALGSSGVAGDVFGGGSSGATTLVVRNRNFNDATIWAVFSAERFRLGTVTGNTEAVLGIPNVNRSDPMYLEIDLVGGERCRTEALIVDPGDELQLDIVPNLAAMPECR
jgi:hypothetical protein